MSAVESKEDTEARTRPAFDLFEGFALTSILASLEMAGLLERLEADGIEVVQEDGPTEAGSLLRAALRYLTQRGLVHEEADAFRLTEVGRAVCRDKGYLVWLAGGYTEPLRHLDALLVGEERYGIDIARDGRWVAKGAALLGGRDVVPESMRLLEALSFERVLDLGCGNARFLISVCQAFGSSGVGVDISPEACDEARKVVRAAGMTDRVEIVLGDAVDLHTIPHLAETQLVITFFLLHEISSRSRASLIRFLSELSSSLPDGAHLLTAEALPPGSAGPTSERFTPEFTFVHAMMRQSLLPEEEWRDAFVAGGFFVREMRRVDMPGGLLILAQKATSWD